MDNEDVKCCASIAVNESKDVHVKRVLNELSVKQDLFLIHKLENEYNDLSDKCNKLYSFMYGLDFTSKVTDEDERVLLQERHRRMEAYRTNLYHRINFYRCRVKIACGYGTHAPWDVIKEKLNIDALHAIQEKEYITYEEYLRRKQEEQNASDSTEQTGDGKRGIDFVRSENGKVVAIVPEGLIPKGLDDVDINKACDELAKAWKAYCEENHDLDTNHCGQDAHDPCGELGTESNPIPLPSPVDDGSADVDDDLPESLKKLVGMQVVSVGDMPCDGCPVDHYGVPCVKVELVGGTLLCLSPLPNSIITE